MSVSVQQVLGEARRLVGRLREEDASADRLLAQAHALGQGVEAQRQYHEETAQLSCSAATATTTRPRAALVLSIQQENRHMRQLQHENRELVAALKEHQSALELIMAKYREQVARLGSVRQAEQKLGNDDNACHHLADKVCEMAAVMRRAAEIDEGVGARQTETLVRLSTENAVLRQLLDIGRRAGSAGLADGEAQTEPSPLPPVDEGAPQ